MGRRPIHDDPALMIHEDTNADDMQSMLASAAWELLSGRLHVELQRKQADLERSQPLPETEHLRGYIAALRMVTRLPSTLLEELRSGGN